MGQEAEVFAANGIEIEYWEEADAPARRRRWHDAGDGTHAVLLASASDVDDLIPTLVAFQIEWNKLRVRQRAAGWPLPGTSPLRRSAPRRSAARRRLGPPARGLGRALLRAARADRRGAHGMRVRMLGGTLVGYARMTRRWWQPVQERLAAGGFEDRPVYFVSSNTHSLVNIATGAPRQAESKLVEFVGAAARGRHPATGARPLPGGPHRGLLGELPLLRGAPLLRLARRGGPSRDAAPRGRRRAWRTSRAGRRCACRRRSCRSARSTRTASTRARRRGRRGARARARP